MSLQSVIDQALAHHHQATLPDKSEKPDPNASPEERSQELQSEAKQRFLAVAETPRNKFAEQSPLPATSESQTQAPTNPLGLSTQNAQASAVLAKQQTKSGQQQKADVAAASLQVPDATSETSDSAPTVVATDVTSKVIASVEKDAASEKPDVAPEQLTTPITLQQPSTNGAEAAPAAQESPAINPQETYDQIVLGLKGQMDPKSGKAQITLDPPNLGAVKVSLSLANGVLTAQFESSTSAVRDLLKSNLDKLKTVLQGQGIAVDKLAVEAPAPANDSGATGGQMQQNASGSGTHDGRSAGGFGQESRSGQERWQQANGANGFAQMFAKTQEAPIDLVA